MHLLPEHIFCNMRCSAVRKGIPSEYARALPPGIQTAVLRAVAAPDLTTLANIICLYNEKGRLCEVWAARIQVKSFNRGEPFRKAGSFAEKVVLCEPVTWPRRADRYF